MTDRPGLFDHLYDDAAIFPPGDASLEAAVPAHRAWLASPHAMTVGTFVCSAPRLDDLARLGPDFPVSVTVPDGPGALPGVLDRVDIDVASVEVPLDLDGWPELEGAVHRTEVYAEVRLADLSVTLAARLASAGIRLKVRTGGADAAMFPTAAALAEGIVTAVRADLPFKLTAGLHHALRHRDPATGFEHHGFGNVLAATAAAVGGAGPEEVAVILDDTDADTVVTTLRALSPAQKGSVRSRFRSFGTCSIQEPLEDLAALGLLPATTGTGA
ncbi:hypothetical protein [Nocardioides panacisoli]|uniref:Uncharacterized protein n=1 Tax=Nocardioides panacisoli TaxID=627624 RepID=A0ABP7J8V6_9ACTN